MDVGEFFALLRRRWAVLVPMLVLTTIGIAGAWAKIHTQYESQIQLTMINAPQVTHEPGNDGNPFLAFDATLGIDVDFLARNVTSSASAQQLAARGVTEQYTAGIAVNALGPFMQLSVTGPNRQHVVQSMQVLVNFTEQRWTQLQKASSAPSGSIIGMSEIAPASAPSPVRKRKIEAVAGVAILGLILSVLVTVAADSIARRRTTRHRRSEAGGIIPRRSRQIPRRSGQRLPDVARHGPTGNGSVQHRSPTL